ncbi:MAG: hypothetical protein HYR48_03905 [Gemmatimonadetes bacterium]|nr:hypothetical protein [Gemmatimonadota bacterium]
MEWVRCSGPENTCVHSTAAAGYTIYFREQSPERPKRVTITRATDNMIAPRGLGADRANLEVSVVDDGGNRLPNQLVTLSLEAHEGTAGHSHTGEKPTGELSVTTVNTGAEGRAVVRYTSPLVSGPVTIRGQSSNAAPGELTATVGIGGLVQLGGSARVQLIGETAAHPSNHWGTQGLVDALDSLASLFYDTYHGALEINDISLELGGVFDLRRSWVPPHAEHRVGRSADVRTRTRTAAELEFITRQWEIAFGGTVHDETTTDAPHYHLRY